MNSVELYRENILKKVGGRWAIVSRKTHRPLAYYRGHGRPPASWIRKQEQRIQMFKHMREGTEEWSCIDCQWIDPGEGLAENPEAEGGGMLFWLLGGLALFAGGGFLLYKLSQPAQTAVTVTPSDNGKTITIKAGQTLNVQLPPIDTGSTGYRWIQDSGDTAVAAPTASAPAGFFSFAAAKPGTTTLVFGLYPPIQSPPTQTFQIRVVVQ